MQTLTFSIDVSDSVYQNFTNKIGKENLALYFANFIKDYGDDDDKFPPAYQRFGGVKPFHIPDDFDDEIDFDEWIDEHKFADIFGYAPKEPTVTVTPKKGAFEEFFGVLQSDKSVSIEEMNQAIKLRGGQV